MTTVGMLKSKIISRRSSGTFIPNAHTVASGTAEFCTKTMWTEQREILHYVFW